MRSPSVKSRSFGTIALALALVHVGCSDPVPPPPQGGVRIRTSQLSPTEPGKTCSRAPSGHTATIPMGNVVNSTQAGTRVVSGEGGAVVECTVKGEGSFAFSGKIEQNGDSLDVSGSINGTSGTGSVSTVNPTVTLALSSLAPCTFTVNGGKIGAGYIWADYACPRIGDPSQGDLLCKGDGTFVFENCISD